MENSILVCSQDPERKILAPKVWIFDIFLGPKLQKWSGWTIFSELEQLKREWMEEMKANMADNDKQMEAMRLSYEEKLKKAKKAKEESSSDKLLKKINEDKKTK